MSSLVHSSAGSAKIVKLGALACALPGGFQLFLSKFLGFGILVGSFFLQLPQILKIFRAKSVTGISLSARYSEVPINSSTVIYHLLLGLPLSTYGENIVVLFQNLLLVFAVWFYRSVPKREIIFWTSAFVVLCAVQLALPPALLPLLIYINIPFGLGSSIPQIVENAKQGHTGQLAILTCILKLTGCVIRIFTTLTQIGPDPGLLISYGTGAIMNIILVLQGWIYRDETKRVLDAEEAARKKNEGGQAPVDSAEAAG